MCGKRLISLKRVGGCFRLRGAEVGGCPCQSDGIAAACGFKVGCHRIFRSFCHGFDHSGCVVGWILIAFTHHLGIVLVVAVVNHFQSVGESHLRPCARIEFRTLCLLNLLAVAVQLHDIAADGLRSCIFHIDFNVEVLSCCHSLGNAQTYCRKVACRSLAYCYGIQRNGKIVFRDSGKHDLHHLVLVCCQRKNHLVPPVFSHFFYLHTLDEIEARACAAIDFKHVLIVVVAAVAEVERIE